MDVLKRKRGSLKTKITIIKNYFQDVTNSNTDVNIKLNDAILVEIKERLDRARKVMTEYDDLQDQIDLETEDPIDTVDYRTNFEKEYFLVIGTGVELLSRGDQKALLSLNSNQSAAESISNVINQSNEVVLDNKHAIKLPTIDLPNFNGNLTEWLGFRDTFESLIHNNNSITTIQKFHYLKAVLRKSAAQIVESLDFSTANYSIAWNLLCDRYNCPKLLINNHLKSIFEIQTMRRESAQEIQTILDSLNKNIRALNILGENTEYWDSILIYIVANKLEPTTTRAWEQERSKIVSPKLKDFRDFLISRAQFLQTLEVNNQPNDANSRQYKRAPNSKAFVTTKNSRSCALCKQDHNIQNCQTFIELSSQKRAEKVKELKLCLNCLRPGHFISDCKGGLCSKCNGKHNTLLHFDRADNRKAFVTPYINNARVPNVILSTASTLAHGINGKTQHARMLLDSCSQSNFISEKLCKLLKLKTIPVNVNIGGLNGCKSNVQYKCEVRLTTHHNSFSFTIMCLVTPQITDLIPSSKIDVTSLDIPGHLKLADPSFYKPGSIDLLLGAEWFWDILCVGQIALGSTGLIMQKTKLGWIIGGPFAHTTAQKVHCNFAKTSEESIEEKLERFWTIEEISDKKVMSREQRTCEDLFQKTTRRNEQGRFIVDIPFKENLDKLGDSKRTAERRFLNLEKRLLRQPDIKAQYDKFLTEYESLGHMTKVVDDDPTKNAYYLPHHCVIKEESISTKLRVVFDGSAATSTGLSINDAQMTGPTIQNELFDILIRFRKHRYVIASDIEKMYRQVLINPDQRCFQRILWRTNPDQPIQIYQLNTVTYGTASASFLAVRALTQLAYDCADRLPEISRIIINDVYVDDVLTGADSIDEAKFIATNTKNTLLQGGFKLCKWASNEPSIIKDMREADGQNVINICNDETIKTLGLKWNTITDKLNYSVKEFKTTTITKRRILSEISTIFDPLGLLGPVIIEAKILMQRLWENKISWDEALPAALHSEWLSYRKNLSELNHLEIPRHVSCDNLREIELHGFADSSKAAYGACIYMRARDHNGQLFVNLLCSKSRVTPLKAQTIPRLELCAAHLLANLMSKVAKALDSDNCKLCYWSDSTIVLSWLKLQSNTLNVFVSNRVARIQELTEVKNWRHIPTDLNPADCLSRGSPACDLINNSLWWHGPSFLLEEIDHWPKNPAQLTTSEEIKTPIVSLHVNVKEDHFADTILCRTSTLQKACRVAALVLRFIDMTRKRKVAKGFVNVQERERGLMTLVKAAQHDSFTDDIKILSNGKNVLKGKLASLTPFIDDNGILRVGGRLRNSNFPFDKKHQIVLDSSHKLTQYIMQDEHLRALHAGPQLLLSTVRDRFWPIGGRNLARKIVRHCVICFRVNPCSSKYNMGNLPLPRVSPTLPFTVTGVDYAGPFLIREKKGRGVKLVKCYASVFVCFTTKALHFEIVSDLTTESFISALRRFVSRRGKPSDMYSDNGTAFIGAKNELRELGQFIMNNNKGLSAFVGSIGIQWHFIPASSPHFGGIWEAGVKSMKHHLKRVAANAHLLYEDFYTLLVQIEGILNSRPLSPLSTDPNDYEPLTPAHFLIGRKFSTVPDPDLTNIKEGRLSRWQRTQFLQQHIWERWSKEYVSELQRVMKWRQPYPELPIGSLVLIKEDNAPPCRWKLARVLETHRGTDNVVRVATVQTASGKMSRALVKLCPLPITD